MNTKRLIMSVGMLAFVGAAVIGGTGAFFSDTETSVGNVFTAGSVSIALEQPGYTHTWLGSEADGANLPSNYFFNNSNSGNPDAGPSFVMSDLKPGDNGSIAATLLNGANDAFVCARMVENTDGSEVLADNLFFRTGTGPGGSLSAITDAVALNEWFSPTSPFMNLGALPMAANQPAPLAIEYCLGEFTPNTATGAGCEVPSTPNGSATDWNQLQNESFEVSIEYYAVQQRNNEGFMCGDLNVPDVAPSAGEITGVDAEYVAFDDGSTVYTGVYVGFDEINVTDATAVELRLNLDDGTDYSIFGQTSVLNAVNASPAAFSIGGTVITTGSRTSSSWSPQTGTIGNGRSVVNIEVLITLGDGTVITSTIDETSITGQATKGAAFPS